MHTFVLTSGKVSVAVRMHAKVRHKVQLHSVQSWKVEILEQRGCEIHLLLSPASTGTVANTSEVALEEPYGRSRTATVRFRDYTPRQFRSEQSFTHLERRLRLAAHEAARI